MIHQANDLLLLNYDKNSFFVFVFFSTLASYNFHWGMTPVVETYLRRLGWTNRNKPLHLVLCMVGIAGSAWFFMPLAEHWPWIAISIILTFLYSAPKIPQLRLLRNIAIGKTIFLALVWTYVTAGLPVLIDGRNPGLTEGLFFFSRFFFIYCICILFDYRDRDYDKKEGIKSMVTYFDEKGIDKLFTVSLILCIICTLLLIPFGMPVMPVVLILVPAMMMIPLYKIGKKNFSDYLYYIVLDGMMMLPAILTTLFY